MKQRLERALEVAMAALKDLNGCENRAYSGPRVNKALAEIDAILHPVEVIEETVSHWKGYDESGKLVYDAHCAPDTWCDAFPLVELTGTIRREKKAVERSVTVEARIANDGIVYSLAGGPVVFHEHKEEVNGKTGTLTFEWTE